MGQADQQTPQSSNNSEPATEPRRRLLGFFIGTLRVLAVGLFLAMLFSASLWLYTRNNTFPLSYHPDEPGKVNQVHSDDRNFRHPQLMLEATDLWRKWKYGAGNAPDDRQLTVVDGREVTAFFGACSVVFLTLTAYLCTGWWGLWIGAVVFGLCPPLLSYSHYMKEDVSLVVGVALTLLASRVIWRTHRWWSRIPTWALLAAGCALATSGKYVGIATLVMAVAMILFAPGFRWWKPVARLLLFTPLFVLFLGIVNHRTLAADLSLDLVQQVIAKQEPWQSLFNPSFLRGLEYEKEHAQTEHWGLTAERPNSYMVKTAWRLSWPWVAVGACLFLPAVLLTWRRGWGWELLLLMFGGGFTYVLSYSIILFPRYTLPIVVIMALMTVIALTRLLGLLAERRILQCTLGVLLTASLAAIFGTICLDYTWQFGHDSRDALRRWASDPQNIPAGSSLMGDNYAGLSGYVREGLYCSPVGLLYWNIDPAVAEQSGTIYVVICDMAYDRFFEPLWVAAPESQRQVARQRAFYQTLLEKHKPVWEIVSLHKASEFTNPTIKVYRLGGQP